VARSEPTKKPRAAYRRFVYPAPNACWHGVPQRLLTDNGIALNPSRRGAEGQLVAYVSSLGVEAITGKPYKPTTQVKNERFHQTLVRWLDKQPLAHTH
jgi:transposase InsO family protein